MTENEILNKMNEMAIESLYPEIFEKWECVMSVLRQTRRALKPMEHEISEKCWCEPEKSFVDSETGNTVYVHRAIQ